MTPLAKQATNRKKITTEGMAGHNGVHHVLHMRPRISGPSVHSLRDGQGTHQPSTRQPIPTCHSARHMGCSLPEAQAGDMDGGGMNTVARAQQKNLPRPTEQHRGTNH
jgi:hypothetical protein